jgi:hypothetical protein
MAERCVRVPPTQSTEVRIIIDDIYPGYNLETSINLTEYKQLIIKVMEKQKITIEKNLSKLNTMLQSTLEPDMKERINHTISRYQQIIDILDTLCDSKQDLIPFFSEYLRNLHDFNHELENPMLGIRAVVCNNISENLEESRAQMINDIKQRIDQFENMERFAFKVNSSDGETISTTLNQYKEFLVSLNMANGPKAFSNLLMVLVPEYDNHTFLRFIGKAMSPEARMRRTKMDEHQSHSIIPPSVENESNLNRTSNVSWNVTDFLNNMEQLITQAKERISNPINMKKALDRAEKTAITAKDLIEQMWVDGLIGEPIYDKLLARYNGLHRALTKLQSRKRS